MKKYNVLIAIMLTIIFLAACKKRFLEVQDNSIPNRQSYVKDLNSMQEFVRGIYLMLSTKYEQVANAAYPGVVSDEFKVSSLTRPLARHNNWSQVANATETSSTNSNTAMNGSWMDLYNIIRACNFVIEDIDKYEDENREKANDLKGQAYAIRAFVHLRLVNIFAQHYSFIADASHPGVPYITTSDISKPFSRQTVTEVYREIVADLESAIALMPDNIADIRYMNGPAAKAILCRVYLYEEDYQKSKTLAIELCNQHPLMSINSEYPIGLFKFKAPSQTETLFQITPVSQVNASSNFLGAYLALNYFRATTDISAILKEDANDIRNTWVTQSGSNWRVTKFPSGVAGGLGNDPLVDYYVPVVRSSEIFLIAAESCAKTDDDINARLYLNAVRKRANPLIPDVIAGGQALLDLIYKERRKELCFEGFRMWDLQRWKRGVHRTDVFPGYQTDLPYPSNKAIAPIPGQDVTLMGLRQNTGY